jgi:small subunit ribosomal protein S1
VLNEADVVRVRILEIDTERRRLSLSAKQVDGQELVPAELNEEGEVITPKDHDAADLIAEALGDLDLGDSVAAEATTEAEAVAVEDEAPDGTPEDAPVAEEATEEAPAAEVATEEAPEVETATEEAPVEEAPAEEAPAAEEVPAAEADAEDAEAEAEAEAPAEETPESA